MSGRVIWSSGKTPTVFLQVISFFGKEKVNLSQFFQPASNSSLMGALDMGGGSVEISFIPKKHDNILGEDLKMLTLYGNTYSLYAHSYLCYGFNEAQRRLMANLIEVCKM